MSTVSGLQTPTAPVTAANTKAAKGFFNWAFGSDSFVRSTASTAGKTLVNLPQNIRSGYQWVDDFLGNIPGYKGLAFLEKGFILFQSALDLFQAGQDSVQGFSEESGGWFDKIYSGIMSGVKSFGKSVGVLAASTGLSYGLPMLGQRLAGMVSSKLLAGLLCSGPMGFVLGMAGAIGGGMLSRYVLDKVFDTHGHVNTSDPRPADIPQSGDDIANQIQYTWRHKTFDPNFREPNPWLNVDSNFDPQALLRD